MSEWMERDWQGLGYEGLLLRVLGQLAIGHVVTERHLAAAIGAL